MVTRPVFSDITKFPRLASEELEASAVQTISRVLIHIHTALKLYDKKKDALKTIVPANL